MSITIRPGQPKDVDQAVPLIYSSGPDAFNYVFSDSYQTQSIEFLKAAFVDGRSEFGYKQHTVAVLNSGEVVGIGGVRFSEQNFRFTLAAVSIILRFYGAVGGIRTIGRGLKIEQVIKPPKQGVGITYHIGVSPEHQSRGIGTQLIDHLVTQIQEKGMGKVALDVSINNPRAHALYERLGFESVVKNESQLSSDFGFVAPLWYMERPLP